MKNRSILRKYSAILALAVTLIVALSFEACTQEQKIAEEPTGNIITMTTKASEEKYFTITVAGDEDIAIDWGDGKKSNLNDAFRDERAGSLLFSHMYSGTTAKNIVITGNVTRLYCRESELTALDVSESVELTYLDCIGNLLTALDVSRNRALTSLECSRNQLTALNVSNNTALERLFVGYNQLTALDVSKNTALTNLYVEKNKLTALDVSENTALIVLVAGENQLTALDVSKNIELRDLHIRDNQLKSLDVSTNTALIGLYILNNQFTASALNDLFRTLNDVRVHGNIKDIAIGGNPGVDDSDRRIALERGWTFR